MNRRRLLATAGTALSLSLPLAGCSTDDAEDGDPGRIDSRGHARGRESPMYTFGHASDDGQWGVLGSFPTAESDVASTLIDLSELESPTVAHELGSANPETRSNDVKFDALREGIYYRSQEADGANGREGLEVIDFGWAEGTPSEPERIARLETPNTGVHKLTTHPEEPVLYLVDLDPNVETGLITVDVGDPAAPELVDGVGPAGGCHDLEYDPVRDVLHAAYIVGPGEGYVVYDVDDPLRPTVRSHFEYADRPDYEAVGEPGFELCHQAHPDPERDLVIVGDEVETGVPGGKHVLDIGWGEGSLDDPEPIGFTHAPDAREMDSSEAFWWTTHFHDLVHDDDEALLVDGGYRQGAWVANLTDPTNPVPTERFATVGEVDKVEALEEEVAPSTPPFAWSAVYNDEREFVLVSDSVSGAHVLELSAEPARGDDNAGPEDHYDLEAIRSDDAAAIDSAHDR